MKTTVLLHADEIARVLDRLACQIMERHGDCEQTVLLGIQRRGVDLAVRLGKVLEDKLGRKLPFGTLDINLYRDDWTTMHAAPPSASPTSPHLSTIKTSSSSTTCCSPGARSAPRWKPSSTMAAPRRWNSLSSWIAATANCPSTATTWAAKSTRPALKRSMSLWKNATAGTKSSSKAPTLNDTRPGGQVWSLHVPVPASA